MASLLREKLDKPCLRRLEVGNVLARDEHEVDALDHEAGKVVHYWLCLYVKIAEHTE